MKLWLEKWLAGSEWRMTMLAVLIVLAGILLMLGLLDAASPYRATVRGDLWP